MAINRGSLRSLPLGLSGPLLPACQLDAAVAELPDADVPIKRLLLLLDLARQGQPADQPQASLTRWAQVLRDLAVRVRNSVRLIIPAWQRSWSWR